MPSVEELLSVAEADANTRSAMVSRIEIDADTRIIRMMPQDELFGVESDEKSERKYFKVPKIVGNGVDLSKLQLRINYQNASKIPSGKDMYIVTDATVYNDEWVYFSWELSRKVTQYKGNIYFIVCAVKSDSNGNITNEWNTTLAEGKVLEGLEVETNQEQQYQASDYLEQLKQQLLDYSKEIKDTFPSDYTQIQDDIGSLKGDLVELQDAVFDTQTDFVEIKDVISLPNRIIVKVSDTSFSTQNSDGNIHNIIGCSVSKGERIKIECSTFNNNDVGFGYVWATTEDTPELWNNYNAIPMLSATEYDYICGNTEEQWKTRKVELTVPSGAKKIWVRHMLAPHIYKGVPIRTSKIPTKISQLENDSGFIVKEEQTKKIPVVCFNFDQTALDDRYAILKDYGLTATFGDGDETSTKTLIKNGFDICPYLGSHTLSNISDEAIQTLTESIATKKSILESWGLYNPVMCLCSGHKWTYALEQALINNDYNNFHYVRCATQYDKNNDIAYTPTDALPSDRFQYPIAIEQYNVEQIKNIVDNFITKKHPLIMLMMHAFIEDGGSNISKAQFTEIVEYVKELVDAGTVKCMNMRQYYEYYYPEQAKEDDRTRIFSALTN